MVTGICVLLVAAVVDFLVVAAVVNFTVVCTVDVTAVGSAKKKALISVK